MNRGKLLDRLQFHDDLAINQQIELESLIEDHALEFKRDTFLPLDVQLSLAQVPGHHCLVDRLKQPWPKAAMHTVGSTYDFSCDLVYVAHWTRGTRWTG